MRTIIDKLKTSVEALEIDKGCGKYLPFYYDDEEIQNIRFDNTATPLAACVPIESAMVQDAGQMFHERLTLAIWFADKMMYNSAGDYDALLNERIIDKCKRRAFRWAASLSPTKEIRLVSVNGSMRAYLERDAYLTGYMINVTIEEVSGIRMCDV